MADYVVEAYRSVARRDELERPAGRQLAEADVAVRYLPSVFLRAEATCFHSIQAPHKARARAPPAGGGTRYRCPSRSANRRA